ncbi:MAG: hypothetical protein IPP45_12690 [Sphingomonadales bacterium]|nr:hypothetical protein [Sphingomonadales bacterium]
MAKAPTSTTAAKPAVKKAAAKPKAAAQPKAAAKPKAAATPKAAAAKAVKPTRLKAAAGAETFKDQATAFVGKAGEKAREYASTGKDKATDGLFSISDFVDDIAKTVDARVGKQYGDYARRAATAVSGVADSLKGKEIDDLVADTRKFVREKPAVAIGAAAAIGFVLTRLFRSGSNDGDDA